jgi:hypothetical protein
MKLNPARQYRQDPPRPPPPLPLAPAWRIALLYASVRTATELAAIFHGPASPATALIRTGATALLLAGLATILLILLRPPNRDCRPRAWLGFVAGAVGPLAAGSAGCYLAAAALSGQLGMVWRW